MLKTIKKSSNKKLGDCAATYRAGIENVFDTCPNTCKLKPAQEKGTAQIDHQYLNTLLHAVPKEGYSWTYTHFAKEQIPITQPGQTCVNISTDSYEEAISSLQSGHPTVVVVSSKDKDKVKTVDSVRFVRCPAEYDDDITCSNCGGEVPLCARHKRNYVIKFTAHGAQAKKIDSRFNIQAQHDMQTQDSGGCYGNGGPVRLQWEKTKQENSGKPDHILLKEFVDSLPEGTKLRHHVVGDIGKY